MIEAAPRSKKADFLSPLCRYTTSVLQSQSSNQGRILPTCLSLFVAAVAYVVAFRVMSMSGTSRHRCTDAPKRGGVRGKRRMAVRPSRDSDALGAAGTVYARASHAREGVDRSHSWRFHSCHFEKQQAYLQLAAFACYSPFVPVTRGIDDLKQAWPSKTTES